MWFVAFREERRLRLFEKTMLRKIFGPKGDEVTGKWRKPHNKRLNDLWSLPYIIRVIKSTIIKWAGHVERIDERCVQGFDGVT